MTEYTVGQLLRSNGRWSLTHAWEKGTKELRTKCGLVYEEGEVYDGDDVKEVFITEAPERPSLLRCAECFEDGTAKVVRA